MQKQITLTEQCHQWQDGLAVDQNTRRVTGVALAGRHSKNGYHYAEQALAESVPLYENKPVFLDHATHPSKPNERSTRDLVGHVVNPRFEEGRVRGDIVVLETESGQTFLQLVKAGAPGVGMSHVVLARRSADGKEIEAIEEVVSVDVVVNPATTTTFRESCAPEGSPLSEIQEQLDSVTQQRNQLRVDLEEAHGQLSDLRRECFISQALEQSSLPASAVTPLFREQLQQAGTEQECRDLLHDREQLYAMNNRDRSPVTSNSRVSRPHSLSDEEFVRQLRNS